MKKNVFPLVVIALVVAVLATGIFYGLIVSRMDGSSSVAAASNRFVAVKNFEKGQVLRAEDFRLAPMADPGVPTPTKAEDLVGRRVLDVVEAGKPILESILSPLAERGLMSGVPEGMRAVTVHVSDSSSVVKLLHAGDRVDIQALLPRNRNGEADLEVKTLLQNTTVFNVSSEVNPQLQGKTVLTVLVSPQDAERLSAADAGARLRVILRNQKDQQIVPLGAASLSNLGQVAKPVVTSSFVAQAPTARPSAAPMEFEVSLIEISAEEASAMAPGWKQNSLAVSAGLAQSEVAEKLKAWQKDNKVLTSSRLVAQRSAEFGWKASDQNSLRVRIETLTGSNETLAQLRIQPESMAGNASRKTEAQVQLTRHQSAIVSGLTGGDQLAQLREKLRPGSAAGGGELLMVITPIARN
jgi:Flp pilus assembly protein CpaB